jgi:hypothetical protein
MPGTSDDRVGGGADRGVRPGVGRARRRLRVAKLRRTLWYQGATSTLGSVAAGLPFGPVYLPPSWGFLALRRLRRDRYP